MLIEVLWAWPRKHDACRLELAGDATVATALAAAEEAVPGLDASDYIACAIFGRRAGLETPLRDGDRVELLRPLQTDPKQARRRRAASSNR